jgi:hypothetical protein
MQLCSTSSCGGPSQQAEAEPLLQRPNRMAERRLGHPEFRGRSREAALVRDSEEGHQVVKVPALHLSIMLISPC